MGSRHLGVATRVGRYDVSFGEYVHQGFSDGRIASGEQLSVAEKSCWGGLG